MDFSQIEGLLGLAGTALGTTGKAVTTVEAIKKLIKSEKKPDEAEAVSLLNNLAAELTAANMMNVQISEKLKSLSQELKRQDEFEREKARYELFETPVGDMVFKLREDAANGQPMHFICPVCLNAGSEFSFITGEGEYKVCQKITHHSFRFKAPHYMRATKARTDWNF